MTTRAAVAPAMRVPCQNAIWYLEGELTSISGKARALYNEAVEATEIGTLYNGASPDGVATWFGLGNVRVLNMWGNTGRTQFKQDQLVAGSGSRRRVAGNPRPDRSRLGETSRCVTLQAFPGTDGGHA